MPVLPPDIEAKYFRVLAVLEEVAHLRSSTRFGGGARLMLNVLHKALTRLSKELDSLVSGTDAEKRAASGCASAASYIHHALQLVQGADEDRAPNSLVEPLETLAQQYMPGCRLLVRAAYDGGLMAYWCEFFVPWLQKLLSLIPGDGDLGQMVQGLVSVVFPSAEKENLLMHAILGHELGHAFSGVLVAPDELPVRLTPETEEWLSQPSNDEGRMVFNNLVVQWRDELLADAWGLHIMGPAYYFACSAAISNTSSSETHPSGPFRLGWLRRQLKRRGYLSQETTVGKWLQQYVEQESKAPILPAIDNALAEKCFCRSLWSIPDSRRALSMRAPHAKPIPRSKPISEEETTAAWVGF